ncbi:MAG: hypothetical protein MEQ07_03260 [Aquimonas sp.]|nr:hypothetical protein [Aquimonas sp.]
MAAVLPGLWQSAPSSGPPALSQAEPTAAEQLVLAALHRELRYIDRRLEAAYLGGDEHEQIARLWQLRQSIEQRIEDPSHARPQLIHL